MIDNTIQYAYGIVICYAVCSVIWLKMFLRHLKLGTFNAFGGLIMACGFLTVTHRNWLFFIYEGTKASDEVMQSCFLSAAFFFSATVLLGMKKR